MPVESHLPDSSANSAATSKYSRMASAMFASAFASSTPWEQHPGKPGTVTLYPSSDRCRQTLQNMQSSHNSTINQL
jgi:hypothetical protein